MARNLPKTCNICFKTMRGDKLKSHMLKHENGRMEDMKKVEEMTYEQKYEMIRKDVHMEHAESKRKIELGRILVDIAVKDGLNTFLFSKEKQEAIEFYEQFGQPMKKEEDSMSEHY